MARLLVILLAMVLIAGCKVGSGGGDLSMGSYYDSGSSSTISTNPYTSGSDTGSGDNPTYPQPEPSTLILFGVGLGALVAAKLRRNKRAK